MTISGVTGNASSTSDRKSGSFAETLRKEGSAGAEPQMALASAKSFQAGDLAAGLSWMSPDFMPRAGEGMLDATAMGQGAVDEMRRYEEKVTYR